VSKGKGAKSGGGPDMGGLRDDLTRMTQMRQQEHAAAAPPPAPAAKEASRPAPAAPRPSAPAMTRRSWYVDQDAAAALAAAVDDVHFATRVPKHVVASALFRAAAAQADAVAADLKADS
jgi:hypothetical protein